MSWDSSYSLVNIVIKYNRTTRYMRGNNAGNKGGGKKAGNKGGGEKAGMRRVNRGNTSVQTQLLL